MSGFGYSQFVLFPLWFIENLIEPWATHGVWRQATMLNNHSLLECEWDLIPKLGYQYTIGMESSDFSNFSQLVHNIIRVTEAIYI